MDVQSNAVVRGTVAIDGVNIGDTVAGFDQEFFNTRNELSSNFSRYGMWAGGRGLAA